MRKIIPTVLATALVLGAFVAPAAEARKRKKRTVTAEYQAPAIGAFTVIGGGGFSSCGGSANIGCVEFPTTKKDKTVQVTITDSSGQKVGGFLSQGDTNGDGVGDGFGTFCGGHPGPVPITPGVPLEVSFYAGTCEDGSPSTPTTGKVKAVFATK